MNISFQKKSGDPDLKIAFFWKIRLETKSPAIITDHFIPELFYDFLYVRSGKVTFTNKELGEELALQQQALKTIHTHPLTFHFTTPLELFGARLSLDFAESFWEEAKANSFLNQNWVEREADTLDNFAAQVADHIQANRIKRNPYPMFKSDLDELDWLVNFSPRHKRRLYKNTFGLSRKELQNIRNVHTFLEQTCDYGSQNPRLIEYVNPEVFYDQPHLNHTFKKMTGFSPLDYFEANSILQDNLMSASYNAISNA